jgi:hypothetical protein
VSDEIEVYYGAGDVDHEDPANAGLRGNDLSRVTRRLEEAGVAYRVVDPAELTAQDREEAYHSRAVRPSVRRRYRVRRVFGTNKYPGAYFGAGVPALVVLEDGRPVDVYPHEEQDGTIVTIRDYLDGVGDAGARAAGDGAALARRMDSLRARIGRVGATARELIEDGRRL